MSTYVVAELGVKGPVDFGKDRRCVKCGARVHRYATETAGYLLCEGCIGAKRRLGMSAREFVEPPKAKRDKVRKPAAPKGRPRGAILWGLEAIMEAKGLTCMQLGGLSGRHFSSIGKLRSGRIGASAKTEEALSGVLGVSVRQLRGEA